MCLVFTLHVFTSSLTQQLHVWFGFGQTSHWIVASSPASWWNYALWGRARDMSWLCLGVNLYWTLKPNCHLGVASTTFLCRASVFAGWFLLAPAATYCPAQHGGCWWCVCELSMIHPGPWALWESFKLSLPRWCTDRTRTQRRHLSSWTRMLFKNTNKCCSGIHSYLRLSCYVDAGPNVWNTTWKAQRNQLTPGGTCMSTKYAKQTSSGGSSSRTSHSS